MTPTFIPLSDPHITAAEIEAVRACLASPSISAGPAVEAFEDAFAILSGRKYAIATASGALALLLALKAYGIGAGDEVIASAHSFTEAAHAIAHSGATAVFADIDYWSGTLVPEKAAAAITDKTAAIVVANTNGHPAPWNEFEALAKERGLPLIEDSTEAIGSVYQGKPVGSFGACSIFDFSQTGAITCGEGGMVVTDDEALAFEIRRCRGRALRDRGTVISGATVPFQAKMSDMAAALGLTQLRRLDETLTLRKRTEGLYFEYLKSFEGIKDPYIGPEVDQVHMYLYVVHLGTRFSKSSRDAIIDDLRTENIEAVAYSYPMHLQRHYFGLGNRKGSLFVTEKVADRAIALPFHAHLTEEQIAFIVGTLKDASINVGAGTAIYL